MTDTHGHSPVKLSSFAQGQLESTYAEHWEILHAVQPLLLLVGGIFGVVALGADRNPWILIMLIPTMITVWLIFRAFRIKSYRLALQRVTAENELDFARAQRLKDILNVVAATPSSSFGVNEPLQPGTWRPFRVERTLSQALRGELVGMSHAHYWIGGDLEGRLSGQAVPNLLDSSTILFLKNEERQTLRVLVPSPRAVKEFLVQEIESWLGSRLKGTHTRDILDKFSIGDRQLIVPISHPQVIDGLDAACELPFDARPQVNVIGQEVQPGVVMASALEVNRNQFTFFPSGLLAALAEKLTPFIGSIEASRTMVPAAPPS